MMTPEKLCRLFLFFVPLVLFVVTTGCAGKLRPGVLDVSVVNQSDGTLEDVRVVMDGQVLSEFALAPGKSIRDRFRILRDDSELSVEFIGPDGRRIRETYPIHGTPDFQGSMELRVDRKGLIEPVSRYRIN